MKMTMMRRMIVIITKMMMIMGSLNNDDVEDNENVEKANRFGKFTNFLKERLCTWIKLNCIFRWCRLMTCLISRFWTTISDSFFFFNLTPELIHQHLTNRYMENKR